MSVQMTPALRLENVSKVFEAGASIVRAIDNVSLQVDARESVAILGRSGSGKSTLLSVMGLLERPDSGSVWIGDRDTGALDDYALSSIRSLEVGYVFQNFQLLSRHTVLENVCIPGLIAGRKLSAVQRRARDLLELVGLSGVESRCPNNLSGGQQQRVAIARALINEPRILLADEPTGSLDQGTSDEIVDSIVSICKNRAALVVVTHDRALADKLDRIVEIRDGKRV